jgi:hypothetical protein
LAFPALVNLWPEAARRFLVEGSSFHVVESGHNRSFALQHEREWVFFMGWPTGNTPTPVAGGRPFLGRK